MVAAYLLNADRFIHLCCRRLLKTLQTRLAVEVYTCENWVSIIYSHL